MVKTRRKIGLDRKVEIALWALAAGLYLTWGLGAHAQAILPDAETQFVDGNGAPYGAGMVCFYVPSTLTAKATYSDPGLTVANPSPCVTLDANGRALIWGAGSFRQRLFDVNGALVWDQITAGFNNTTFAGGAANTTGASPNYLLATPGVAAYTQGLGISWRASFTSVGNDTLNVNSLGAEPLYKPSTSGPIPIGAGDVRTGQVIFSEFDQNLTSGSGGFAVLGGILFGGGTVSSVSDAVNGGMLVTNGTTTPTLAINPPDLTAKATANVPNDLVVIGDSGASGAAKSSLLSKVLSGRPWQIQKTEIGSLSTGSSTFSLADSIPQCTGSPDGDLYMSVSITPTNTASILVIDVLANVSNSNAGGNNLAVILCQDSTANALAATVMNEAATTGIMAIPLRHFMLAGTTSATTFKVRIGGNAAGGTTFNGASSARIFGGVMASSVSVTEYLP